MAAVRRPLQLGEALVYIPALEVRPKRGSRNEHMTKPGPILRLDRCHAKLLDASRAHRAAVAHESSGFAVLKKAASALPRSWSRAERLHGLFCDGTLSAPVPLSISDAIALRTANNEPLLFSSRMVGAVRDFNGPAGCADAADCHRRQPKKDIERVSRLRSPWKSETASSHRSLHRQGIYSRLNRNALSWPTP